MNHIHLINDTIIGNQIWKGREDLVNIVMVGLAKEISAKEEKYELHRLFRNVIVRNIKGRGKN